MGINEQQSVFWKFIMAITKTLKRCFSNSMNTHTHMCSSKIRPLLLITAFYTRSLTAFDSTISRHENRTNHNRSQTQTFGAGLLQRLTPLQQKVAMLSPLALPRPSICWHIKKPRTPKFQYRGAHIQIVWSPGRLNCVGWHVIFSAQLLQSFPYTQILVCLLVHMRREKKCQITVRFAGHSRIVGSLLRKLLRVTILAPWICKNLLTCTHLGRQHRMTVTRGCIDTICLS